MSSINMKLIIDKRETKIINYLKSKAIEFKELMLDLGDIIIEYDNIYGEKEDNSDNTTLKIIIERKTLSDLISSLRDGRYKEQKTRLLSLYKHDENVKICYILEGNYNTSLRGTLAQLHGCIISMIFRDNIHVINTSSIEETCSLILQLQKRMIKNINDFFKIKPNELSIKNEKTDPTIKTLIINDSSRMSHHTSSLVNNYVKPKRQDNITEDNCASLMLSYIPGVSIKTSCLIMSEYNNSLTLLCDNITKDIESVIYKLSELKHSDSNRRLGNKLAKRIVSFLTNNNYDNNNSNSNNRDNKLNTVDK